MKAFPPLARWAAASILSLASALAAAAVPEDSRRAVLPADAMPSGAASVQLWHAAARDAIARHKPNQQAALRLLAYLSLAQHRAAEALAAGPGPASDAAWSALFDRASVQTLDALLPAQAVGFDALAQGLASAREASLPAEELARVQTLAEQAAREVLERAAHDGYDAPWHGSLPQDAAAWRSLLNPARPPHLPGLGSMKTLFLASGSAVRPPAPPAPGSARFAEALAEVRERAGSGSPQGLARARRWEMTSGSLVAGFWDETAVGLAARHGLSGRETSRALVLAMGAALDANIACHDAKYTYWAPRPSQADAAIRPLIGVPNHPSYPSNHACDSGAAAAVLSQLFPAQRPTLEAMALEASESRIDAGLHYRFDSEAGLAIGRGAAAAALRADALQLARKAQP